MKMRITINEIGNIKLKKKVKNALKQIDFNINFRLLPKFASFYW